MVSPNETFTELVTTTLREHPKKISDVVSNHNALYRRMNKKGLIKTIDGGYEITRPLAYAENGTYQRYSGWDTLNVSPSDVMSAATYAWKQAVIHVTANGLEVRANSGKNQILDLVENRIMVALKTFANNMSTDLYSDGTASNQINGLQLTIADSGTGTVGGINSSTYTWWKNKVQSAAAPLQGGGSVTISSSTIENQMSNLWLELSRGADEPDFIVASNDYYSFYENSLTALKRYTQDNEADGGFVSLKYKNADVFHDGGSNGGGIPAAHMYFVNTDYLELVVHKQANLTQAAEKPSFNQDGVVIPLLWQGNLCTSNRGLLGVMKS